MFLADHSARGVHCFACTQSVPFFGEGSFVFIILRILLCLFYNEPYSRGNTLFLSCKGTAGIQDSTRGKYVHGAVAVSRCGLICFPPRERLCVPGIYVPGTGMRVRYILRNF